VLTSIQSDANIYECAAQWGTSLQSCSTETGE